MRKKALVFLLLVLTSFANVMPSVVSVNADPSDPLPRIELWIDQPYYYMKGNTMLVKGFSNESIALTLKIYWNWKTFNDNGLVYQNTRLANATWNIPTANQKPGFYKIVLEGNGQIITSWRTLIHTEGYSQTSLPFSHVWKGINYTLQGRTLKAEKWDEDVITDWVQITYPKIPVAHRVRFYHNNMTLLVRLDDPSGFTWAVDLLYMTIHSGLKWVVNGTLQNPGTYAFQVSHSPRQWIQNLHQFSSDSNLVFDWEDIQKAQQAFTWNSTTKKLSVTIPSTFSIDPTIFQDGFESGDLSAWDSTYTSNGELSVTSQVSYQGSYSANFTVDGSNGAYLKATKTFQDVSSMNIRSWVNITEYPDAGTKIHLLREANTTNYMALAGITNQSGSGLIGWYVKAKDVNYINYSVTEPSTNVFHALELHVTGGSNGYACLWVDDVLVVNATGIDYSDYGNIRTCDIIVYLNGLQASAKTFFHDSVVLDDEYIGVNSGYAPEVSSFTSPSTVYADELFDLAGTVNDDDGVADFVNCTVTLDDDRGHSFSLKWLNNSNSFSEDSDTSNFCTLQGGTRTTLNATAYTLTWTFLIRETFPEGPVDVVGQVFDTLGDDSTATNNDLFTFNYRQEGQSGSSYTPPSPDTADNNETTSYTPLDYIPSGQQSLTISPVIVVGIIALGIVIATAYTQTPNLKRSRKKWKENKKKHKNPKWTKKKKQNKLTWKTGDAWE